MKRLLAAKIVLIAALTGSAKELRYFNVVPVNAVFMPFGFPCEIAKAGLRDPRNVYVLTRNSAKVRCLVPQILRLTNGAR